MTQLTEPTIDTVRTELNEWATGKRSHANGYPSAQSPTEHAERQAAINDRDASQVRLLMARYEALILLDTIPAPTEPTAEREALVERLADPDIAATGDGRVIADAINLLTLAVRALSPTPHDGTEVHR